MMNTAIAHAETSIAIAAAFLSGARYSMKITSTGAAIASSNCDPTASASDTPSSRIRRQFHNTTSRGAYSVWHTAIPVNTAPNMPQTAATLGGENQSALARMTLGEEQ